MLHINSKPAGFCAFCLHLRLFIFPSFSHTVCIYECVCVAVRCFYSMLQVYFQWLSHPFFYYQVAIANLALGADQAAAASSVSPKKVTFTHMLTHNRTDHHQHSHTKELGTH